MRLLDKPLTRHERQQELDMLQGNLSRICTSDDPVEIIRSVGFAVDRLNMIGYSRVMELQQKLADAQKNF